MEISLLDESKSARYAPLHPIGRERIAFNVGGERMGDGAGDGGVGGHQRDLADPLRTERTLGEFSLDEVR